MTNKKTMICNLTIQDDVKKIDEIINGYKYYSVLAAALETGLFDWLEKNGPADKEKITESLCYNGMFTRCFLTTLGDMELVIDNNGLYTNSYLSKAYLLSESPFFQGDVILSQKEESSRWKDLSENIVEKEVTVKGFNEGPSEIHLRNIAQRGIRGEFQTVVSRISQWKDFQSAQKLLDIGGGHGLYSIALCQIKPDLDATVFDKPHVVQLTSEFIEEYEMHDRISVIAGDMTVKTPQEQYDIIIMSHLLYKFRKDLPSIFRKVSESIREGGLLVLNHWFCSPGCIPESGSAINDLEKSLISFGHPLCYPDEFARNLNEAGFEIIDISPVPTSYGNSTMYLAEYRGSRVESPKDDEDECCPCKKCC